MIDPGSRVQGPSFCTKKPRIPSKHRLGLYWTLLDSSRLCRAFIQLRKHQEASSRDKRTREEEIVDISTKTPPSDAFLSRMVVSSYSIVSRVVTVYGKAPCDEMWRCRMLSAAEKRGGNPENLQNLGGPSSAQVIRRFCHKSGRSKKITWIDLACDSRRTCKA